MLSPATLAELTGLSRSAIYRAIEDGELAASKLRGRIRVEEAEFEAWKERSRMRARARMPAYEPPMRERVSLPRDSFRAELRGIEKERAA